MIGTKYLLFLLLLFEVDLLGVKSEKKLVMQNPRITKELFGSGSVISKWDAKKHISSSLDEVSRLFKTEAGFLGELLKYKKSMDRHLNVSERFSSNLRQSINTMKISFRTLAEQVKNIKKNLRECESNFPQKEDFEIAALGLLNIQNMYRMEPLQIMEGIVSDLGSNQTFYTKTRLDFTDALQISLAAEMIKGLDMKVTWLQAALEWQHRHRWDQDEVHRTKNLLLRAKTHHDHHILEHGFLSFETKGEPERVKTRLKPYDEKLLDDEKYKMGVLEMKKENTTKFRFKDNSEAATKEGDKFWLHVKFFNQQITKDLCSGNTRSRPPKYDVDINCLHIHYNDPFLKLGPFQLEIKNKDPFIGIFHQLYSHMEITAIRSLSEQRMKATPYTVSGKTIDFSYKRTSKIKYLNDIKHQVTRDSSIRIQRATRWEVLQTEQNRASENYQLMNYGIGGIIESHTDVSAGTPKQDEPGGQRMVTFMAYLSSVVGGRTVFPMLGVTVDPSPGSALFWYNLNGGGRLDTRSMHVGCPVIQGSKWIINKWVKWNAQWRHHKSTRDMSNFLPFQNN